MLGNFRVTRRLAWIQPVCISINAVPALKGLREVKSLHKGHLTLFRQSKIHIIFLDSSDPEQGAPTEAL